MLVWLFLFGEREEPPGEFPNRTTNRPTERALLSAEVQVILSACFEQIKQIVFRVGNLLIHYSRTFKLSISSLKRVGEVALPLGEETIPERGSLLCLLTIEVIPVLKWSPDGEWHVLCNSFWSQPARVINATIFGSDNSPRV